MCKYIILIRGATIYRYIVYRIALSLYRCINTKSNRIDISRIVACLNEIIVHCGQPKWYLMFLKGKNIIYSLKSNTEQCFDSILYRTIYRCIVIRQRQYIDTSTYCIVATLILIICMSTFNLCECNLDDVATSFPTKTSRSKYCS